MEVIKLFDEICLLTRAAQRHGETIGLYLYKLAFEDFRLDYAGSAGLYHQSSRSCSST
jgi:ABC-type sugar transport system permease subunit